MASISGEKSMLVLVSFIVAAMMALLPSAFAEEKAKKLDGKSLFEQKCFKCHKPQKFKDLHNDRKSWDLILSRMQRTTCVLSEDERDIIVDYLVQEHGE